MPVGRASCRRTKAVSMNHGIAASPGGNTAPSEAAASQFEIESGPPPGYAAMPALDGAGGTPSTPQGASGPDHDFAGCAIPGDLLNGSNDQPMTPLSEAMD